LQDLAFFTDVQLKKEKTGELFVTVSRDHRLKHVRLRVYRCGEKKQGIDICETVRKAFTASNRAKELRNGQPFMPLANLASDLDLDTPLLRMEVAREDVVPIRTVGSGQFGLVFAVNVRDADQGGSYERAAKVLRSGATPDTMASFLREVRARWVFSLSAPTRQPFPREYRGLPSLSANITEQPFPKRVPWSSLSISQHHQATLS
jgi:hypothetical protein